MLDLVNCLWNTTETISIKDFENALTKVRTSIDKDTLSSFEKWNVCFGDVS